MHTHLTQFTNMYVLYIYNNKNNRNTIDLILGTVRRKKGDIRFQTNTRSPFTKAPTYWQYIYTWVMECSESLFSYLNNAVPGNFKKFILKRLKQTY